MLYFTISNGASGAEAALYTVQCLALSALVCSRTGVWASRTTGLVDQAVVTLQGYREQTRKPA